MSHRRNAADGKAGLTADQGGIGLAQMFASKRCGFHQINLRASSRNEQNRRLRGFTQKEDRFCNLIDATAQSVRGIKGCAGKGGFADVCGDTCIRKGGAHAFQAFAHGVDVAQFRVRCKRALTPHRDHRKAGGMSTSLAARMIRTPRVFNESRAADAAPLLAGVAPEVRELGIAAASTSPYLLGLFQREGGWLADAAEDPEAALTQLLQGAGALAPDQLSDGLRQGKRRMALLTGLADLGGVWSLEEVTSAVTAYADAAVAAALRGGLAPLVKRGKLPGMGEADLEDAAGMVVLAMGKMGAGELNYSSDIDLICLFDETRFEPDDFHAARTAFVRATRTMSATLNDLTGEGYVFRTDLRLRPDPAVTPVCMAMEAAERYYETLGRTWERAAYIKARPAAGDFTAGQAFLKTLGPFVWRRHLDFAAIEDAHDMRLAIREHKGLGGPITLEGHNMKLGRGGIREIEFFTQTRQLIAGGRDPDLRKRGTVEGLKVLAEKDWLPEEAAQALSDHYRFHRMIEHRQQMVRDAQTHDLPKTARGFERLAAMMDRDTPDLRCEIHERLSMVHEMIEGFFQSTQSGQTPQTEAEGHVFDPQIMERWLSYPALRSARGAETFARLKPDLLERLSKAARPDEALLAFDGFLKGLPGGVQVFALLQANPQLADLLIDIVTTSPALAAHLSRNAGVLDAVIGGDFFSDWPGQDALCEMARGHLEADLDYESQLDMLRVWTKEWHFRIGVHHLRGLIDAVQAGQQYADLASAVLRALWPLVCRQFAKRHGPPPGRGAVVVGMGSLGAGRLTAASDLDMIVIYDPGPAEMSEGPRPLATRPYYARLTQAFITAMTAPMAQGRLYEVDMRLRPSGNQGPVATSLSSFESYQRTQAWVWEHLALTRARIIAGPQDLAADVEILRADILARQRPRGEIIAEVCEMRARIAQAKAPSGPLDAKIGAGRLQDIELFGQTGALLARRAAQQTALGLGYGVREGLLNESDGETMKAAYEACWALQSAVRLLSPDPIDPQDIGQAGANFIARSLGCDGFADVEPQMSATYRKAAQIIAEALPHTSEQGQEKP